MTEEHALAQRLSWAASHDSVTGLLSRAGFEARLDAALAAGRETGRCHTLCYLDLDQFKVVNDTCGHVAGDELLRQLGAVLGAVLDENATLARLGGDEFAVLLDGCGAEEGERVAARLCEAVAAYRFDWEGRRFVVAASIGVVELADRDLRFDDVLAAADAACYAAKDSGGARYHVYRADDETLTRRHQEMEWVARLNRAVDEDRFVLHRQPIVALTGDLESAGEHFELLLRMVDEEGRIVAPGAFLGAAERYGLAARIDRWVVERALRWLAGCDGRIELCSINLSGHSLAAEGFLAFIEAQIERYGVTPQRLCFEITETAAIANLAAAIEFMNTLRARGCRFALDDFGSGLSSFAYLRDLPVDLLKIDGVFVRDIVDDPIDLALVRSINEIGRVMGKRTVAEFVESDAILERLRDIGVDFAQGYGVGRPEPIDESG